MCYFWSALINGAVVGFMNRLEFFQSVEVFRASELHLKAVSVHVEQV